jgi:hypothetical protein
MVRHWTRLAVGALATLALLGLNALAGTARSVSAAHRSVPKSAGSVSAAHRSAAIANAGRLLDAVVMPSGSVREMHPPHGASALRGAPSTRLFFRAQVDRHSFWVSDASAFSIASSIRSHLPAGAISNGYGISSTSATYAYELPPVDVRALGTRQLVVNAIALSSGKTAVRIDAQVQYLVPRTPGQRIPAGARMLQITRGPFGSPTPRVVRTVTALATVRRIAALIDALPFQGNENGLAFSCPVFPSQIPFDTFTFRATADGPVLAKLSESAKQSTTPDPCESAVLSIRGHDDPPIAGGGQLLTAVDRLLGLRLTAG